MAKALPHITAAELRILKILWRIGSGTVRDVKDELEKEDGAASAYTTIMTLMNQLAAKGGLEVDRDRQPFVYKTALRREKVLSDRLKQFLSTVFDGQAGELVLRLVEDANLSADDLKRIEARIEERERESSESERDQASGPRGKGGKR